MIKDFEMPSLEVIIFNQTEIMTTSINFGGGYGQGGDNGETELEF